MAEKKVTKLMAEFPAVSTEQWEKVITADLKGGDYQKKLVWRSLEGFSVQPYYRAENLDQIKYLDSKPGEFPYVRGVKTNNEWLVRQTIKVECAKEANAQALSILMKGVDSLGFVINSKEFSAQDLNTLLNGITLSAVELAFSGCAAAHVAELFIAKIKAENIATDGVSATFGIDPIKRASQKGKFCKDGSCFDKIVELIKAKGEYKKVRVVSVGGVLFESCGSSAVQELALSLAMGHDYITELMNRGLSIDAAASAIKFNMSISSNYFMEMAKFRAGRMLWANIVAQYEPKMGCSSKMRVHATTSTWNMTVYDPYVNMLRGTTEAMSAAIAGVDSIEVLPFDHAYANASEFSSRIARNTQLLLKEESHMDQVVDPSAGSYYIENLTQSIAQHAWDLFKTVESKGGYMEALKAGFIQEIIKETANKRDLNIATRREILLGTNQYPNFTEVAEAQVSEETVARKTNEGTCCCGEAPEFETLKPYRGAMAFEELRLRTDRSGKCPSVFMLTCGNLTFARARAQFSCNFFACAGFKTIDNTFFASVEEGVKAAIDSKAEIVVICSSDDDYATLAPQAAKALAGKATLVVAGEPACRAELEAEGIKHFISVKNNVLETLKGYQSELGIK